MSKSRKIILLSAVLLTIIFVVSFLVFDNMISKRNEENTKINETTSNNESLKDTVKVELFTGNNKEQESTLKELKKQLGIDKDITEEELCETLSKSGYDLYSSYGDEIIFSRDIKSSIEPNKYYIKADDDGYLAIFKSDSEGNLSIEDKENDKVERKVSSLQPGDQDQINNLKLRFDSKEEAEEAITEYIS